MDGIIVGQSGGPTAAINASLAGVVAQARNLEIPRILGMKHGIKGFLRDEIVDLGKIVDTEEKINLLKKTPASFLGSCRVKLPSSSSSSQMYRDLLKKLDFLKIGAFLYIGCFRRDLAFLQTKHHDLVE